MAQRRAAEVLSALRELHGGIAARGEEIEAARHLPADIAASLVRTKAFKLAVPREIGGVRSARVRNSGRPGEGRDP